jgi:predicted nucleic acid-binding protein
VLRVIADTNVYVSALHVGGVADEVLAGARAGQFQLFISLPILQELERVLVGKLKWAPGRASSAPSTLA